jgi:LDH2 family malate/lactate/ureidoglycolate dehydrogenase
MPVVSEARLRDLCQRIVLAMGAPQDIADVVTDVLVKADIKGVDSHGCRLLHQNYMRQLSNGMLTPTARAEIIRQDGATTIIEGNWGFGHPAGRLAARQAIASAREFGVGTASLIHVSHIARLGEYVEMIAEQNMLGMVACHAGNVTTPYGGMKRLFGTNPLALAVPRSGGKALVADFATSAKSVNKLMIYRQREQALPDGVILDKDGYATTDPNDYFDGGILLPTGGYKGYALNLFIEIIGGVMLGAGCSALTNKHPGNGALFVAMDIARWRPMDEFTAELEQLLAVTKAAPLAPGAAEILLPGELEDRAEAQRRRKGIPLDETTWKELRETALKLGMPASLFAK